jgi:hypothetical protein
VPLLLMSWFFIASPLTRETATLIFSIGAVCTGWFIPGLRQAAATLRVQWLLALLVVAHAASAWGGIRHGESVPNVLTAALSGIVGTLGMGVLAWVMLQPRWRERTQWTALAATLLLVIGSLLGYLVFISWHLRVTLLTPFMDLYRLALIWPTRLLSGDFGRMYWDHTNTAAFLFAAAWVVLVDALYVRRKFVRTGWAVAFLLGTAIFLTASRSAWVMILFALPLLLTFRGRRFPLQIIALLALSWAIGLAGVKYKVALLAAPAPQATETTMIPTPGQIHVSGLIERGSAGRTSAYLMLWNESKGDRLLGDGLASNRTPMAHLLHEHSTYLATFRGGGFVALAAHLGLIAISLSAGLRLARDGCRCPLILAVAVFSGLLFDRSTVFRLTGFEEFPLHWLAVWIPLLLVAKSSARAGHLE